MPFDGAEFGGSRQLELIDDAIALLSDERRWRKGKLASGGQSWSILGAMQLVGAEAELKVPVLRAIRELTRRRYRRIDKFNDARTTNHALVVAVLYRARHHILLATADPMIGRPNAAGRSWFARFGVFAWLRRRFA